MMHHSFVSILNGTTVSVPQSLSEGWLLTVHYENTPTGVYIIFLISAQKHRLWYSLEPPRSNEYMYHQSMF